MVGQKWRRDGLASPGESESADSWTYTRSYNRPLYASSQRGTAAPPPKNKSSAHAHKNTPPASPPSSTFAGQRGRNDSDDNLYDPYSSSGIGSPSKHNRNPRGSDNSSGSNGISGNSSSDEWYGNLDTALAYRASTQERTSPRRFLIFAGTTLLVFAMMFSLEESETDSMSKMSSSGGSMVNKADLEACPESGYVLERHDHESRHGDVCRDSTDPSEGNYLCPPQYCTETTAAPAGGGAAAPYCVALSSFDIASGGGNNEADNGVNTGAGMKPCRVPRVGQRPLEYRCDPGGEFGAPSGRGVCIKAVGRAEFKGRGRYVDETCDDECGGGAGFAGDSSSSATRKKKRREGFQCRDDFDCSLSGFCEHGTCTCDPWTTGPDCSYLNLLPVDPAKIGYLHEKQSSWGATIGVGNRDGMYHMFVTEIVCDDRDVDHAGGREGRCGLSKWSTNSRVVHAVSADPAGPYTRLGIALPTVHNDPTLAVSPKDGTWNLYTTSGEREPVIAVVSSTDDGYTWTDPPIAVSKMQSPAPVIHDDGSVTLYHSSDGARLPSPTCASNYIGSQRCPSRTDKCDGVRGKSRTFDHTASDPHVFCDHRGNYHMLVNALPSNCVPKFQQGGHSWSRDGLTWSEPRVGAFDTAVQFSDGSSVQCERRERPQVLMDPRRAGVPLALVTALTGCPAGSFGEHFRGGDDCFTLVQMLDQGSA